MKKLLYVYIGNYQNRNINLEVNMNQEFIFKFDEKRTLTVHRNKNYLENFYGAHIEGITSIIGENGCGKTTFLKFLGDFLDFGWAPGSELTIIVYLTVVNGEKIIKCHSNRIGFNETIKWDKHNIEEDEVKFSKPYTYYNGETRKRKIEDLGECTRWFYTPQKHNKLAVQAEKNLKIDLSDYELTVKDLLKNYKILSVLSATHGLENILPQHFGVTIRDDQIDYCNDLASIIFYKQDSEGKKSSTNEAVGLKILSGSLKQELFFDKLGEECIKELKRLKAIIDKYNQREEDQSIDSIYDLLYQCNEEIIRHQFFKNDVYHQYYNNLLGDLEILRCQRDYSNYKRLDFELLSDEDFANFILEHFRCSYSASNQLIEEMWRLVCPMNKYMKSGNYSDKLNILLLDEPNNSFHPKLQIKTIDLFIKLFKWFYEKYNCRFQIFITTHSPLLLTDLLEDDVVGIGINDKVKTFGANAFKLFYECYNINLPHGEFFLRKFKEVTNKLDNYIEMIEARGDGCGLNYRDNQTKETLLYKIDQELIQSEIILESMGQTVFKRILKDKIDKLRYQISHDVDIEERELSRELIKTGITEKQLIKIKEILDKKILQLERK